MLNVISLLMCWIGAVVFFYIFRKSKDRMWLMVAIAYFIGGCVNIPSVIKYIIKYLAGG